MVLFRRFFLVDMGSRAMTVVAIVLTGVEEVALRATIVARDSWVFTHLFGITLDDDTLAMKRKVWATSINASMLLELCGILLAAAIGPLFARFPHVFDFGADDAAVAGLGEHALLVNVLLQVAAELVVDTASLFVEAKHELPVFACACGGRHRERTPTLRFV